MSGRSDTFPVRASVAVIEEPPGGLIPPVLARRFPFANHVCDPRHANNVLAVHVEYRVIGGLVGQGRGLVLEELVVLRDPLVAERLHDLGQESGQLALGLDGVLALDDMIANEGGVVADKYPRAKCNTYWEAFVMRIAQAHNIAVVPIRTAKCQEAKVARSVWHDCVIFLDDLMPEETQRVSNQLNDLGVGDRAMRVRSLRGLDGAQLVVG